MMNQNSNVSSFSVNQSTNESESEVVPLTCQPHEQISDEYLDSTTSNNNTRPPRNNKPPKIIPRWFTVVYYLTLSAIAILLTIISKGTILWDTPSKLSSERGTLNMNELKLLLCHYLAVLVSFCFVQNSDPGYLTPDVMDRVCERDGLSLLGKKSKLYMMGLPTIFEHRTISDVDGSCNDEEVGSTLQLCQSVEMIEMTKDTEPKNDHAVTRRSNCQLLPAESQSNENSNDDSGKFLPSIQVNLTTRRKACKICKIAPLLRSHHCRHCAKCVATFDHHCRFINTCIGERNHCRFYWFIFIQAIGFIKCFSIVNSSNLGIFSLLQRNLYKNIDSIDIWIVVASRVYLYPLTFIACLMVTVHTFFVLTNATTFETEKAEHLEYLNGTTMCDAPFSLGLLGNLKLFCCFRDASYVWRIKHGCCRIGDDNEKWVPIVWKPVGVIKNDSEDCWNHPWSNKYWTCC